MQNLFFPKNEGLDLPGAGALDIYRAWLSADASKSLFEQLLADVTWSEPQIYVAGKRQRIPRQQAWYGDADTAFTYSGVTFKPEPFTAVLADLLQNVIHVSNQQFNSVLINHYRDENDSVGWHADDEKEFGTSPIIASLSLGETRCFAFKPKPEAYAICGWRPGQRSIKVDLSDGDLIIMNGDVQKYWLHSIPKLAPKCAARINLTFRYVYVQNEKH